MALNVRTRSWLAAASEEAVHALESEVRRLSQELAESRAAAQEAERQHTANETEVRRTVEELRDMVGALREGVEAVLTDVATLRGEVEALRGRGDAQAEDQAHQLAALDARLGQDEAGIEAIRTALAGLVEQSRWDADDLRKAIAALGERSLAR
jgi:chromosome segregation ATPase